ncbi:MAG TPA: hypothetical protein VLD19_07415, partial [Chitinophagaceae bacterium]|nr:hypothetical protein [Chitinophagaceae bacterium]
MTGVLKPILLYLLVLTGLIGIIHFSTVFINRPSAGPVSASPRIATITRDFVYDLSGSEASGLGDAMKLFDENCDPKNDPSCSPVTQPLPVKDPDKFFVAGKGLRIVVDLQAHYALDELYWYDKSPESDSIWLYTGDMQHWKPALVYRSAGSPGGWGWKTFRLQAGSRYVMIRFNSKKSVLTEMVLYGRREEEKKVDRDRREVYGRPLARPSLREFAGTNAYDFVPPYLLASFHDTRVYQFLKWYDADTVHPYPHNRLSLPWGLPAFADSLQRQGNHCWMSIRGIPAWMEKKGMNERDKPVTRLGMDTEDPLSYGRHARSFWTLAALFGHTRVDTSRIELSGSVPFSGAGLMDRFENGNEEDGWWSNYYWNPMDYFALSSADYDGHEGRLGPGHGLKKADTASRLIMSGLVQTDTSRVRTLAFLCAQLRDDHRFVWEGGVQYHYYSTDSKSINQMPTRGISPEEDRLREKLARVRAFHDRLLPGVPLILGENGYDRNQTSRQRTPLLPGHNEAQSQGIMVLRSMMAVFMAGFDGYNQYMMRDATNDPLAPGPYASSGMLGGPQTNTVFPAWHYWNTAIQMLGKYRADSVISESEPVWVYRLRHRDYPDSLAYYLVSPTTSGVIIKNYRLFTGLADNQLFKAVKLADGSV